MKCSFFSDGIVNFRIRGRRKIDGVGSNNILDLNLLGQDSPPSKTYEDTAESDTSSVASSLEKVHEDLPACLEQW